MMGRQYSFVLVIPALLPQEAVSVSIASLVLIGQLMLMLIMIWLAGGAHCDGVSMASVFILRYCCCCLRLCFCLVRVAQVSLRLLLFVAVVASAVVFVVVFVLA